MLYFSKKEQLILIFLAVIIVLISLFNFFNRNDKGMADEGILVEDYISGLEESDDVKDAEETSEIMVHISGQVYNPGIVVLEEGSRLIDAVESAGGLKKEADLDKINLSKKLSDEEKIYIPKIGEEYIDELSESGSSSNSTGKININTCTKEELMTLPGIGDVLADRIIEYRKGNSFKTVEDIINVSGIGEKKFEDIKDLIIVK